MTAPTRILLLSNHEATGGTRDYMQRLLGLYARQGWAVTMLCAHASGRDLGGPGGDELEHLMPEDVLGEGRALTGPWSLRGRRREQAAFTDLVAERGFDLVVASSGTPGLFLPAVQLPTPSIYLLHTYPHGRRVELLGRWLFRKATARIDRAVTVSHAAREQMVRAWGIPAADVTVIHSTAGPLLGEPAPDGPRDTVLVLGHLEPYKGPDQFMAMAEILAPRFPDVRLVWAGSGSLLEQYRAEVRTRGLEGRVAFVGHVDDTDALYRRALVYVQPSRVESLGLALLDAIRHAVPSVVPAVGGMPEVVLDGRTGSVVAPGRPDLLAEAVARLLTDPAERTARGSAARAYYAEEFSEERWDERMAALHREVLGE